MFLAKIPRGVQGFQEKLPEGGPPILGFIAFLLTSVLKIAGGGIIFTLPLPPPLHPHCLHLCLEQQ
jgi:hypothetical protein